MCALCVKQSFTEHKHFIVFLIHMTTKLNLNLSYAEAPWGKFVIFGYKNKIHLTWLEAFIQKNIFL